MFSPRSPYVGWNAMPSSINNKLFRTEAAVVVSAMGDIKEDTRIRGASAVSIVKDSSSFKNIFLIFFHENYDYTSKTDFRIPPPKKRIILLWTQSIKKCSTMPICASKCTRDGVQVKELGVPLHTQIRGRWPRNPYSTIMGSPLLFSFVALIGGEGKRKEWLAR